jgi:putative nucleotidyltransferase with HDIG domain
MLSKSLVSLLKEKEELFSHSEEVSQLAYDFGVYLGLGLRDVKNLKIGGFLHDIGKVEIPQDILFKEGRLTNEEYQVIKDHPTKGHQLLLETAYPFADDVFSIVLEHHERIDGQGYPKQLLGKEIHLLAKLVSLCDVYSAITSKRSYKELGSKEFAFFEIEKGLGTQFDNVLGKEFLSFMKARAEYKNGTHIDYTVTV